MSYGIPYQGSKATIVKDVCKIFPKATHFYDLFGGGFSVTHAMLLHRTKSYKHFHFNEIRPGITELIKDAINGQYSYANFKPDFIDRKRFFAEKESNAYIKTVWSFGNNGKNYLFGKNIEPYKKSMHNAMVFNRFDDLANEVIKIKSFPPSSSINQRRLMLRNKIEWYRKNGIPKILHQFLSAKQLQQLEGLEQVKQLQQLKELEQLERLERLEQLQQLKQLEQSQQLLQLEQLQQLQQLEQLQHLNYYNLSYEQVPIQKDSIVYCDIPYKGTGEYDKNKNFNHNDFFDWADNLEHPVYISEYNISDSRFKIVKQIQKRSLMSPTKTMLLKNENVYINKFGYNKLYS